MESSKNIFIKYQVWFKLKSVVLRKTLYCSFSWKVLNTIQVCYENQHCQLKIMVFCRTAYTRRILEIIGNIKKQREEIDKIVEDTKQLQRDINIVSDRVDRSVTYADELIFRVS